MSCSPAESSIYSPRVEEEEEARRGGGGGGGGGEEISVDVFFFFAISIQGIRCPVRG